MAKCVRVLIAGLLAIVLVSPLRASELRGLWVDAWHPGFKTPDQATAMVNKAKKCNFNTLFIQVRRGGDVYYRSKVEPMASDVAKDYDPLADVIAKAHAAGLKVHAWLVVYRAYHDSPEAQSSKEQVSAKHPEWLTKDARGNMTIGEWQYLDPGVPAVKAYLAGLVEEIVKDYDVDGIHLDRFAYPNRESGYNETALAEYEKINANAGIPNPDDEGWCEWRRDQVTSLLVLMRQKIGDKKNVELSAAVSSNLKESAWHRLEDWTQWIRSGRLTFAVPMLFVRDKRIFESTAKDLLAAHKGRVCIGQGGWKLETKASVEQFGIARKLGAKGVVLYNYALCCDSRPGSTSVMDELRSGLYASWEEAPDLSRP